VILLTKHFCQFFD